jgi:DNA-binding SARP family transcriptional activator
MPAAFALLGEARPGAIDQDVPHGNRSQGEEMGTIAPGQPGLVNQLQVGFVDQPGGGEGATSLASGELSPGNDPQFVVDGRHEPVEAAAPPGQDFIGRDGGLPGAIQGGTIQGFRCSGPVESPLALMPNSHDPHARNTFRLLTLGGLSLVDPTGAIVGQQRRRLALLALVASAGERGVSRDRLVACLSPESPTEAARHALEQLVYYLRKRVGVELFLGTDPLRLNPALITSDLADFERALQEGHPNRAASLYRGPFLEGFHLGDSAEFEDWAATERARLGARHLQALSHLGGEAEARGDHVQAVAAWRQVATLDPLSGRGALGLMRALAGAGDAPAALRHALQHEALVRAELGSGPDAEVTALAGRLTANARPVTPVAVLPSAAPSPLATPVSPPSVPPPRVSSPGALIGWVTVGVVLAAIAAFVVVRPGAPAALAPTDQVLVVDFDARPQDSLAARALSEALRGSLSESRAVRIVSRAEVDRALVLMERPAGTRLDPVVGSELAARNGYEAILSGAINPLGAGFVVSARLTAASGRELATLSETAASSDDLIAALGRLSKRLRRVAGESEIALDLVPPLQQVTTPSLRALEAFTQAVDLIRGYAGQTTRVVSLLEQAIAADSTFAMAHRQLGMVLVSQGSTRAGLRSLRLAERHADRLTEVERLMALSSLHLLLRQHSLGLEEALAILRRDPYHAWAESQVAWHYLAAGRYQDAEDDVRARSAVHPNPPSWYQNTNAPFWSWVREFQGRGREALDSARANYRHHQDSVGSRSFRQARARLAIFHSVQFGYDSAERWALPLGESDRGTPLLLATSRLSRGQLRKASSSAPDVLVAMTAALLAGDRVSASRRVEAALTDSAYRFQDPADRPVRPILALALAGKATDARRELAALEQATDADVRIAREPELLLARGAVALVEKRLGDAIAAFSRASKIGSVSGDLEYACRVCALPWLGRAYEAAGRPDSAAAAYERYLSTGDPDRYVADAIWRAVVLRHLGDLHATLGDTTLAVSRLSQFVDLWSYADRELQPQVEQARRRIAQLRGQGKS